MSWFDSLTKFFEKFLTVKTRQSSLDENPFSIKGNYLYKDGVRVRFESTTKMSGKITGPRYVVNHYTANNSLSGTINVFKKYSASSHLIIDRDGTVVQMVPFNRIAWHAGKSKIKSKWGTLVSGLNKYSIGLEFVNFGYSGKHVGKTNTVGWPVESHKNENGKKRKWQPYTEIQIEVAEQLNAVLMDVYEIPIEHIVGHDDISPNRKVDPGPLFPMGRIKSRLGNRK